MDAGGKQINAYVLALKIKKVALIVAASGLSFLGIFTALYFDLIPGIHVTFSRFDKSSLIDSVTSGNNTVDIYQHDNELCVDTHSTSQADIPHQSCETTSGKISRNDISLDWFTLNGGIEQVEADYPHTTSVHILIEDDEKILIDYTESFIENLVDAFNEGIKTQPAPKK